MARRRKRPLRWYIVWTLVYFFIAASLLTLIASLPVWRISIIEVENNQYLNAQDILNLVQIPLGENIFFVKFDKTKANLDRVVQIENYRIKRSLPSKIIIYVNERQPFATAIIDDLTTTIDKEGVIIWESQLKALHGSYINILPILDDTANLPVVKGLTKDLVMNEYCLKPKIAQAIGTTFSKINEFLPTSSLNLEMNKIDDINLMIEDVIEVKIGDLNWIDKKIENSRELLNENKDHWGRIEYLDVRFPNNPVIKFR